MSCIRKEPEKSRSEELLQYARGQKVIQMNVKLLGRLRCQADETKLLSRVRLLLRCCHSVKPFVCARVCKAMNFYDFLMMACLWFLSVCTFPAVSLKWFSVPCFLRFGGWSRPPVSPEGGRPPEGPLPKLEEDSLLQAPGGLQDNVARIQEDLQEKWYLWVLPCLPSRICVTKTHTCKPLAHICLISHRLFTLHFLLLCISKHFWSSTPATTKTLWIIKGLDWSQSYTKSLVLSYTSGLLLIALWVCL